MSEEIIIKVHPGTATEEDIQALLDAISELYVALGGSGLRWERLPERSEGGGDGGN